MLFRWAASLTFLLISNLMPVVAAPDFAALVDSVESVVPDFSKQAKVENLLIDRGGVKLLLESGTLTLSNPVNDRVIAATFVGEGRFQMTPPNSAEKYMLAKLCKDSVADWNFEKLALFFTDHTAEELAGEVSFSPLNEENGDEGLLCDFVDYYQHEFKETFGAMIVSDLIQPNLPGRFTAAFKSEPGKLFFFFDPKEVEEISLKRHVRTISGFYPELVSSFHSLDQYHDSPWGPEHEDKDLIDSLKYQIDCKIWQSASADFRVALSFVPVVDSLRALSFDIFDGLEQGSIAVLGPLGDSLYWDKLKEEDKITVYMNAPLPKGIPSKLTFVYSSKRVLEKTSWGNTVLVAPTTWYPRYGYLTRASYKLRFACPEQYTFLSVGKKTCDSIADGFRITEWDMSEFRVASISFNYGLFYRDSTSLYDGTPLEVYGGKSHGAFSDKLREAVTLDLKAAGALYGMELTPYPFHKLWATEIPANHGQGLPGFIHLAWGSFELERPGYTDAFVAHELAHQWWGHVVGWESYHDQWLSEGFAEYMAAWYIQRKYMDNERYRGRFFELLDDWKNDVMQSGSYLKWGGKSDYQEGNEAGPIWMGYRLASSKSSDYFTLVYSKGAYVLYMLRMMMFDFPKQDDSRFLDMLKDFVATYYWQEAGTADFIRIAEKHYGSDLSWFFDQYLYGTEIPHYRWKVSSTKELDGRYLVTFDIETENVDDNFQMLVPVTIVMEGDYHATMRIRIDKLKQRITLPKIPYKPTKIVFNTYKSVLCTDSEM